MEAHSPPTKLPRMADSGMGMEGRVTLSGSGSGSTSIGLDLGLGPVTAAHGKPTFTFLQMQELEHQALIYKYMAAGIPVPSHLVVPIWKSLSSTYAGTGIYPTFLGCRGVCFDYRNTMEPEPQRCRRTDGKKWRCAKEVVPDSKYCERHMHRGRNRSRKHVEAMVAAASSSSRNGHDVSNTNLAALPLQLMAPTTTATAIRATGATTTTITSGYNSSTNVSPKSVLNKSGMFKAESS